MRLEFHRQFASAALPQHMAESLWLSDAGVYFTLRLRLRPDRNFIAPGEAEAEPLDV
jgi:hypothetical protein